MNDNFKGFVPIHTIFYVVFHPTEGTKVRYEFPPGNLENHNINFDTIKNFIIPKAQLCHRLLTLKYKNYRIVSYPVTINSSFYARNFFSFNFVFVFQYDCETSPYEPAITRLAKMFKVLEEQNQILSKAERDPVYFDFKSSDSTTDQDGKINTELAKNKSHGSALERYREILNDIKDNSSKFSVQDLVMRVYQDLNNYSECLIPIDDGNAVDIRVFPVRKPPNPSIAIEDVPISIVNLSKLTDVNWDPTMVKIVPFIDGLNSISKISKLSDSDPELVVECIKHLVYYNCVILSDIFQFSNIYAPTSLLRSFLTDANLAAECQSYVFIPEHTSISGLPFTNKSSEITGIQSQEQFALRKRRDVSSRATSQSTVSETQSEFRKIPSQSPSTSAYQEGKQSQGSFSSTNTNGSNMIFDHLPTRSCLFDLYRSLSQGVTLKRWYDQHFHTIQSYRIDVRRLIIFGVVKNLIYRCYSFPVLNSLEVFDLAKKVNNNGTLSPLPPIRNGTVHNSSKNIFSSADIKFGAEEGDKHILKRHQRYHMDIGEEALQSAYKKLSLTERVDKRSDTSPTIARLYHDQPHASLPDLSKSRFKDTRGSERPSKVSFNMKEDESNIIKNHFSSVSEKIKLNETLESQEQRNKRDFCLLESLKSVENLDRICVRIEKPRHETEILLRKLGNYKIVNS